MDLERKTKTLNNVSGEEVRLELNKFSISFSLTSTKGIRKNLNQMFNFNVIKSEVNAREDFRCNLLLVESAVRFILRKIEELII